MRYIEESLSVRVRFSESDAMGVVWHGNYLKYFEDGREKLGERFGMTYMDIYNSGYFAPIVQLNVKYRSPITFGQEIKVVCRLVETKAAKLIHEYEVWNLDTNKISCEGSTEQVFLNKNNNQLEIVFPNFYAKWKDGLTWKSN